MSQHDRLVSRLLSKPIDFTYDEAVTLLSHFGYLVDNKGRTSGSRVKFFNPKIKHIIFLHRPHPKNILKSYQIKEIITALQEQGFIN